MPKKSIIFINFMTYCNYRCVFCANRFYEQSDTVLSYDSFKNIISLIDEYDVVDITGSGEITCHKDFDKIINLIMEKKKKIRMVTNGSNIRKYSAIFLQADFSELVISLNSLNPDTYAKTTGGDLTKVLDNIEFMRGNRPDQKLILSFVMTAHNFKEMRSYVDFGKKYDATISCLGLTPTLQQFYSEDLNIPDTNENRKYMQECREYAAAGGVVFSCFNFNTQRTSESYNEINLSESVKKCTWVHEYTFIGSNGDVGVCCWNNVSLGNINTHGLAEIYAGEKYNDLLACIKSGDLKYCKNCRMFG